MLYTLGDWFYQDGELGTQDDVYFLNLFSDYQEGPLPFPFVYQSADSPELTRLRETYRLRELEAPGDEFRTQCNLLNWVNRTLYSAHAQQVNDIHPPASPNTNTILDACRGGLAANCFMHAVVLSEVYLAMGYRSRMTACYPMDLRPSENHCVTQVYSGKYQKWIAMDAALNVYYVGEQGIPLSLQELRRTVAAGRRIWIPGLTKAQTENIRRYWAKNIFRCQCSVYNGYNAFSSSRDRIILRLNPKGYERVDTIVTGKDGKTLRYVSTHNEAAFWK